MAAGILYNAATSVGNFALDVTSKTLAPIDPLYESYRSKKTNEVKWRRRPLPPGLTSSEAAALRRVRTRAHYLDDGYAKGNGRKALYSTSAAAKFHRFCIATGVFVHGRESIITVTGNVRDVLLHYSLVMRPAMNCGIPASLRHRMLLNYALAANAPMVPVIGSHLASAVKPNSRNAMLFEDFLIRRALARQKKKAPPSGLETPKQASSPSVSRKTSQVAQTDVHVQAPQSPQTKSATLLYVKGRGEGADEEAEAPEAEVAETQAEVPTEHRPIEH